MHVQQRIQQIKNKTTKDTPQFSSHPLTSQEVKLTSSFQNLNITKIKTNQFENTHTYVQYISKQNTKCQHQKLKIK